MIKLILSGLWVCLVTLASTYAAVSWHTGKASKAETQKLFGGLESVKTRMISVPIVADGAIHGYVMAQFVFTVDTNVMKRHFKKQDLPGLSRQIADNVNKRLGVALIDDVLVQEMNYIAKENVRGGLKN
jgi:hypothetical protein